MLLFLVIYGCAVFTKSHVGVIDDPEYVEKVWDYDHGSEEERLTLYGSVPRACYTLFMIVTLEGWDGSTRPMVEKNPAVGVVVILFIMLCSFGLMNIVIGVIVENTFHLAKSSDEEERKMTKKMEAKIMKHMESIFSELDTSGDGRCVDCLIQSYFYRTESQKLSTWVRALEVLQGGRVHSLKLY